MFAPLSSELAARGMAIVTRAMTVAQILPLAKLAAVPDFSADDNDQAKREWLLALCEAADVIGGETRLRTVDPMVDLFREWIEDDAKWSHFSSFVRGVAIGEPYIPSGFLYADIEAAEQRLDEIGARIRLYLSLIGQ